MKLSLSIDNETVTIESEEGIDSITLSFSSPEISFTALEAECVQSLLLFAIRTTELPKP